jgi:hypothetical protein
MSPTACGEADWWGYWVRPYMTFFLLNRDFPSTFGLMICHRSQVIATVEIITAVVSALSAAASIVTPNMDASTRRRTLGVRNTRRAIVLARTIINVVLNTSREKPVKRVFAREIESGKVV